MVDFWEWFENFKERLGEAVGPFLKPLFDTLNKPFEWVPTSSAWIFAVGLFVLAAIWSMTLKEDYVYQGAVDRAKWRDLRIWTLLIMVPYIIIYLVF